VAIKDVSDNLGLNIVIDVKIEEMYLKYVFKSNDIITQVFKFYFLI
jgi:hypothetical protein